MDNTCRCAFLEDHISRTASRVVYFNGTEKRKEAPKAQAFVLSRGIGLGPTSMGNGDHVCILPGGRTPFIIRSRYTKTTRSSLVLSRSNFAWTSLDTDELLGDCYVQGLMDGEAMKTWNDAVPPKPSPMILLRSICTSSGGRGMGLVKPRRTLTEDGAQWEREARNGHYSADTWSHENSKLWDQPKEAKDRLWNGDQPKWQIARRDYDDSNRSWADVGGT